RLSPLELRGREIWRRRFLSGVPALVVLPGTTALLFVMLGSTSFDGLSSTVTWRDLVSNPPSELAGTLGLATMIGVVAAVYSVGIRGMHEARGVKLSIPELRARFIHTLVPIAFAYVLAHYCTFLLYQGQAIGFLVSDPLGHGSDLFGTAHATIDYHLLSKAAVWYLQVGALVCGHVAAIALAHDRALALFPDRRLATRTQQWMLTAMVGFTSLGLWLLASIKG
ncbi:MAG: fenitrothion hydrolase, partial [Thermoleophilaceae bacterium]